MEWVAGLLFLTVILVLLAGFPVAFTLGGTALIFAAVGVLGGNFNEALLSSLPNRIYGIMTNQTLVAVPLFVFMGVTLERARIAEDLLETLSSLFGRMRGGLGISVTLVGMLLAASTGIVGATVVTMGLLSLPTHVEARLLRRNFGRHNLCVRNVGTNHSTIDHSRHAGRRDDPRPINRHNLIWVFSRPKRCPWATCSRARSFQACCWCFCTFRIYWLLRSSNPSQCRHMKSPTTSKPLSANCCTHCSRRWHSYSRYWAPFSPV